jgi:acyl carrier protein
MIEDTAKPQASTDVRARVRELVRTRAPNPAEQVGPETHLEEDLHYDSLALIDLAVSIEREFELTAFAEAQVVDVKLETVGDIELLVDRLVAEARA